MKKKAKRYDEGGILRDSSGNPVRSGSGEVVRTRFGGRKYNEEAPASMIESSDYSGRRMKSPDVEKITDVTVQEEGEAPRRKITDYIKAGPKTVQEEGEAPRRKITDYIKAGPKAEVSAVESMAADDQAQRDAERRAAQRRAAMRKKAEEDRAAKAAEQTRSAREMGAGYMKAAEASKPAAPAKEEKRRGFGPKITFNTPEKLEKARKAYYSGFKSGGKVSSASSRADGIAQRGKTRGKIC